VFRVTDEFQTINQKLKQGGIVTTNEKILKDDTKKYDHLDGITTTTVLRMNAMKKFLEEKQKKLQAENKIAKE